MERPDNNEHFIVPLLRWTPRICCMLLAAFLMLFSFDVFGQGTGFWKTVAGFLIHNIPSIVLILILVFSWKWPWVGGICFFALGILYLVLLPGRNKSSVIDISLFAVGILFLLDWYMSRKAEKIAEVNQEEK